MPFIQLQFRRGNASQWTSANPILADGELAIESDTSKFKIGNGISSWNILPYGGLVGPTGAIGNIVSIDISFNSNIFVGRDVSFGGKLTVRNDVSFNTDLRVGGNLNVRSSAIASSSLTGALIVGGGVGVGGNIWTSGNLILGLGDASFNNRLRVGGDVNFNGGNLNISKTTVSTSSSTGTLIVGGGVGVGGNIWTSGNLILGLGDASFNNSLRVGGDVNFNGGNLNISKTTVSTSSSTGALIVGGGVGVGGNIWTGGNLILGLGDASFNNSLRVGGDVNFNGGNLNISKTTASSSSLTGALIVGGGVGVGGNIWTSGNLILGLGDASFNNSLRVGGDVNFNGGNLNISKTTVSTSSSTGALIVGGGVGVGGNIWTSGNLILGLGDASFNNRLRVGGDVNFNGGNLNISKTTVSTSSSTGALIVGGGVGVGGNIWTSGNLILGLGDASFNNSLRVGGDVNFNGGNLNISKTTVSTSSLTGALIVGGGVGVGGNIWTGGNLILGLGDASFNGNTSVAFLPYYTGIASVTPNLNQLVTKKYVDENGGTILLTANNTWTANNTFNGSRFYVNADASFNGNLTVVNDASLNARLFVGRDSSLNGNVFIGRNLILGGDASLNDNLSVQLDSSFNANLYVGRRIGVGVTANSAYSLDVLGNINLSGSLFLNNKLFSITSADISLNANLSVGMDASFNGNVFITKTLNLKKTVIFGGPIGTPITIVANTPIVEMIGDNASIAYHNLANGSYAGQTLTIISKRDGGSGGIFVNSASNLLFNGFPCSVMKFSRFYQTVNLIWDIDTNKWIVASWQGVNFGGVSMNFGTVTSGDIILNAAGMVNISSGVGGMVVGADSSFNGNLSVNGTDSSFNANVRINRLTTSINSTSGALIVAGGAGIGGNIHVGGNIIVGTNGIVKISNTTTTTSSSTGALIVQGGVGVGDNIFAGGAVNIASSIASTSTTSGALKVAGGAGVSGNIFVGGNIEMTGGTINPLIRFENKFANKKIVLWDDNPNGDPVTDTDFVGFGIIDGIIDGFFITGLRYQTTIEGSHYFYSGASPIPNGIIECGSISCKDANESEFSGSVKFNNNMQSNANDIFSGALSVPYGGVSIGGNIEVRGNVNIASSLASTSTTSGALKVAGGAGVAGNLNVGGAVNSGGAMTITGNGSVGTLLTIFNTSPRYVSSAVNVDFKFSNGTNMARISVIDTSIPPDGGFGTKMSFNLLDGTAFAEYMNLDYTGLTVTGNVTATSFNATSDYRIKNNVHSILEDASFNVDVLRPVTYTNTRLGKQDIGFIAHEVGEHYPYLVNGEKDGAEMQSLNYTGIIGILVKEIQELKKQVAQLNARF